jgi:WD40 repeat protein
MKRRFMPKLFFLFLFLVFVILGCVSPLANPATLLPPTNSPEIITSVSITPTLQPTLTVPCDEQYLPSIQLIDLIIDNNKINQIQLSGLYVKRIDFNSDSTKLFLNTSRGIYIVDVTNGQTICVISDENTSFTGIALSPNGSLFASVNRYGEITLRDPVTGAIVHQLHNGLLQPENIWNWVEFNGDGSLLVSAGYFQPVRVWDTTSGQIILETLGIHAAISQNGELLAVSGSNYIQIINIADKEAYVTRVGDSTNPFILFLLFSRDGNFLYALNAYSEINVWDVKTGELVRTLNPCPDCTGWGWEVEYPRISHSVDGTQVLLADPMGIIMWNTQTWEKIFVDGGSRDTFPIVDASVSPNGKIIVINHDSNLIRFLYLDQ